MRACPFAVPRSPSSAFGTFSRGREKGKRSGRRKSVCGDVQPHTRKALACATLAPFFLRRISPMNAVAARSASQTRAFVTIWLIELWERFGYYGMAAILVLYMVEKIGFDDATGEPGLGRVHRRSSTRRRRLAAGSAINVLGTRRTMPIGAAILAIGYLMLSCRPTTYTSSTCRWASSSSATACSRPTPRTWSGASTRAMTRRSTARSRSTTWPSTSVRPYRARDALVIKDHFGWHAAFAVCCAGLILGLINYVLMMRTLRRHRLAAGRAACALGPPGLDPRRRLACVFIVAFVVQYTAVPRLAM